MGRRRLHDRHLPRGVTCERGTYFFRGNDRKRVNLGRELGSALAEYARIVGPAPRVRTVGDVIDRYRTQVLPLKRSAQTRRDEAAALTRLKAVFGALLPDAITAPDCYRYLDERRTKDGDPAPVAARHEIALLGHVLAKAIRWGAATANVVRTLERQPKSRRTRYVTDEEFAAVRALASPRVQLTMDLARIIGQRREDLLSLRRDQITDAGIIIRQGKAGAGVLIEWSEELRALIERAWAMAPQIPREYVIRKPGDGRRYSAAGFSAMWQRVMKKYVAAGGERFTFHDLRAKAGSDKLTIEEASALLGHASTETTKRVYKRTLTRARPVR